MPMNKKEETDTEQDDKKFDPKFRRFYLVRKTDKTGMSGTGYIAEGIQFQNGVCVLNWLSTVSSTNVYHSVVEMEHIHTHAGKDGGENGTYILWVD